MKIMLVQFAARIGAIVFAILFVAIVFDEWSSRRDYFIPKLLRMLGMCVCISLFIILASIGWYK